MGGNIEASPPDPLRLGHRTAQQCNRPHFAASAASMAFVTSGEPGFTEELKRLMILPSRPMRNLVKFQPILPGNGEFVPVSAS